MGDKENTRKLGRYFTLYTLYVYKHVYKDI